MKVAKDYYGLGGSTFEEFAGYGNRSMNVLPQLIGRKWDNCALAWVHTLRPSKIRVSTGELYCDAHMWRVTIIVDENDIIQSIMQECRFGFIDHEHWRELQEDRIR